MTERPTLDRFLDLFLAALVMRNKRHIWVRTDAAHEERRRMYALHKFVAKRAEEEQKSADKDYLHFLLRLRNHLAPSLSGSFDTLQHSILQKMATIISVNLAYCENYRIDLQKVTAKCWLENADKRLRELAEAAADIYLAPLPKKNPA